MHFQNHTYRNSLFILLTVAVLAAVFIMNHSTGKNEFAIIDIHKGIIAPEVMPLRKIADSIEIIRFKAPSIPSFNIYEVLMLDQYFVIEHSTSCLLFDRQGNYIREIARKGNATDNYKNCNSLNVLNNLIYITDFDGITNIYSLDGKRIRSFTSPNGFNDQTGIVNEHELVGYRVNNSGSEKLKTLFYAEDTIFSRFFHNKEYPYPKRPEIFYRDGQFIRTSETLLFKELLNDTIYSVSANRHAMHPHYVLYLDSLSANDSLRYIFNDPKSELFCHTPYVILLGEHQNTCWLSTIQGLPKQENQIYATHCYDKETKRSYSFELKMSFEDMRVNSRLLYDTTTYYHPSINWDNFFPERMSQDGRYLIASRGQGYNKDILIIARLKEKPLADLLPVSISRYSKATLLAILFILTLTCFYFFKYKRNKQDLKKVKIQMIENIQTINNYRRELEQQRIQVTDIHSNYNRCDELEQQIYLLNIQNEELTQRLITLEQKSNNKNQQSLLSISDEGYKLFMKLKTEPSYIFIGDIEYEHLCRVTDELYHQFSSRLQRAYPDLTKHDIETCCLLKAGLTNKELSIIFNNTPSAITKSKNRIKKRMGISNEINLDSFLFEF